MFVKIHKARRADNFSGGKQHSTDSRRIFASIVGKRIKPFYD